MNYSNKICTLLNTHKYTFKDEVQLNITMYFKYFIFNKIKTFSAQENITTIIFGESNATEQASLILKILV